MSDGSAWVTLPSGLIVPYRAGEWVTECRDCGAEIPDNEPLGMCERCRYLLKWWAYEHNGGPHPDTGEYDHTEDDDA